MRRVFVDTSALIALLDRADYERQLGVDPVPAAREAEAVFGQALERLPARPSIRWNLADLHLLLAGVELDRGRDPEDRLRRAAEAIAAAEALDKTDGRGLPRRDKIRALRVRWQARGSGAAARDARSSP